MDYNTQFTWGTYARDPGMDKSTNLLTGGQRAGGGVIGIPWYLPVHMDTPSTNSCLATYTAFDSTPGTPFIMLRYPPTPEILPITVGGTQHNQHHCSAEIIMVQQDVD